MLKNVSVTVEFQLISPPYVSIVIIVMYIFLVVQRFHRILVCFISTGSSIHLDSTFIFLRLKL